jgi:hypothetical protein
LASPSNSIFISTGSPGKETAPAQGRSEADLVGGLVAGSGAGQFQNPLNPRNNSGSGEPSHAPCVHNGTGGLRCPVLTERHQALFGLGAFCVSVAYLDLRVAQFDQFLNLGPQGITQLLLCRLIFVFEGQFVEIGLVAVLLVCRPRYRDGNAVVFNLSRLICCSK